MALGLELMTCMLTGFGRGNVCMNIVVFHAVQGED